MKSIDLNADLGEGCSNDGELLKYISSANIACGMHAGSPLTMVETVRAALAKGVNVGAHPGYPDRAGFGRRKIAMPYHELKAILVYQIGALKAIVNSEGGTLTHVKAHGAMYNSAASDRDIARAIVTASRELDRRIAVFGPPGSLLEKEARDHDMRFVSEFFADRAYLNDASLVPRSEHGALIEDKVECADRTLQMINQGFVLSLSGEKVEIKADTVCLHGDTDSALEFAKHLNKILLENNIHIGK